MTIKLKVFFNSKICSSFLLINPPVLPLEGENIEFEWAVFMDNSMDIALLNNYEDGWISHILSKRYHHDGVDITVVLFETDHYSKLFPNRFYSANSLIS